MTTREFLHRRDALRYLRDVLYLKWERSNSVARRDVLARRFAQCQRKLRSLTTNYTASL